MHKSVAPKDLVKVYESGDAVVLPAWDPMVRRNYVCVRLTRYSWSLSQGALA